MKTGVLDIATSIRLTNDIEERLNFLSAQTGLTKAYYLRQIIEKVLIAVVSDTHSEN